MPILSDTIKPCSTWNNITSSCALVFYEKTKQNDKLIGSELHSGFHADLLLCESGWPQGFDQGLMSECSRQREQSCVTSRGPNAQVFDSKRNFQKGHWSLRLVGLGLTDSISLWPGASRSRGSSIALWCWSLSPELMESLWSSGLQESFVALGMFAKFTFLQPHASLPKAKKWLFVEKKNAWNV